MSLDYIGIDVHKLNSQVCILTTDGELLERRIKTDRVSLEKMFAGRTAARILIEASTESEWVGWHRLLKKMRSSIGYAACPESVLSRP